MKGAADWPSHWRHQRRTFFKYVTYETAWAILRSHTLRWSNPRTFNDPFDMQFSLHSSFDRSALIPKVLGRLREQHYSSLEVIQGNELGRLIAAYRSAFPKMPREEFDLEFRATLIESFERLADRMPSLDAEFQELLLDAKVLCLSEQPDSLLMWSHYAQLHRGIVLELACVPELDSVWGAAMKVKYYSEIPPFCDEDLAISVLSGQASLDPEAILDRHLTAKAFDWAYEKEWRIVLHFEDPTVPTRDISFNPRELAAVYVGCQMPQQDREAISSYVRRTYPATRLFAAEKRSDAFRLAFRDL